MSLASRRARRRLVPLARPPTHERASTQGRKIAAGAHDRPHAASYCCAQVGDSHQAEESEAQAALAMTLWDASGRVKIERAKEHISQLDIASREFFDTNPYEVRFEPDKELEGYVVRIIQRELAPSLRWSAITADAVHNLRASLDILWRMAIHGKARTTRRAYFPIYDTAEEFKARKWGEPQRANVKAAVDILTATKPYKG